jgi:hypothetical protein
LPTVFSSVSTAVESAIVDAYYDTISGPLISTDLTSEQCAVGAAIQSTYCATFKPT